MARMKWISLMVAFSLGLLLIGPGVSIAEDVLKVAALQPLSGGAAPWGVGSLRAVELMADKINDMGGIKVGDKNYKIEVVPADTKTNPNEALNQANRLVFEEKVKYIVGPIITSCVKAVQPVTEKNKTIIMVLAYSPTVLGPDKKYTFRFFASGHERLGSIYDFLKKEYPSVKTIGLIGPNDESAWGTSEVAKKLAEKYGFKVVFEDFVQRDTTDYFPVMTKLISKNPDVLIPHSSPPAMTALQIQQARQLGYKGMIVSPSHFDLNLLIEKAGKDAVEGFIFQTPAYMSDDAPQEVKEVVKKYEAKYKEAFNPIVFAAYGYLWILKTAIETAGTLDTTKVADTLETLSGTHPFGTFKMGGQQTYGVNHQIEEPMFMSQVKDGKLISLGVFNAPAP